MTPSQIIQLQHILRRLGEIEGQVRGLKNSLARMLQSDAAEAAQAGSIMTKVMNVVLGLDEARAFSRVEIHDKCIAAGIALSPQSLSVYLSRMSDDGYLRVANNRRWRLVAPEELRAEIGRRSHSNPRRR